MQHDISSIINKFQIQGNINNIAPYGSGHINDTFKIDTKEENKPNYLLQRVNHHVFKDVPGLMDNIERILNHIKQKLNSNSNSIPEKESLTLIPTKSGKTFFKDNAGNFWRVFLFIDGTHSYDVIKTPEIAYQGGKAFGRFQKHLADLPGKPLNDTIPNFHNIEFRLNNFNNSLQKDSHQRVKKIKPEIEFVEERSDEMRFLLRLNKKGLIPIRNCHNDTKLNNVLYDKNDNAVCVIDLDTAMQGLIHYDFGDSIRTATNTSNEDEKDLNKINFDIQLFDAYSRGFLRETKSFITIEEVKTIAFSGKLFAFIMGLRFLTDYIDGDIYYKTNHEKHNLERARAQFQLLKKMEEQYIRKQEIIEKIFTEEKNS